MNDEIKKDILDIINSAAGEYNEPTIIYSKKILSRISENLNQKIRKYTNMNCLYSVKANLNVEVISILATSVHGFDVASWNEYKLVEKMGRPIFASGFAFSKNQIIELIDKENFDFVSLQQFKSISSKIKNKNIGIRISGNVSELERNLLQESRFGLCYSDDAMDLKKICKKNNICVNRLHIHLGEKNLNNLSECINELIKWCDCLENISQIDIGGGWDYLSDADLLNDAFEKISLVFKDKCIYIEPGSLLVRKAGILVAHVIDYKIKEDLEGNIVVDASAFNLSSWYTPKLIAIVGGEKKLPLKKYNIYGNTCFENDIFQRNQELPVGIEDDLFFYPVGAYYTSTCRKLHNLEFPKEIMV